MVRLLQPQPGEVVQDLAAGTGGFLVAADRAIKDRTDDLFALKTEKQRHFQREETFRGLEVVPDTHRLSLMNLMLHGIGGDLVRGDDAMGPNGEALGAADLILTNPPFGTKKGGGRPARPEFTVQNVRRGRIDLDLNDLQHVRPPSNAEGSRTRLEAHDITITITADLSRVGLIDEAVGEAYVNQHVALARPTNAVEPAYLAWFITGPNAQEQLGLLDRGATRSGLGLKDIQGLAVPLPPLGEQRRIVARIEALFARTDRDRADLERIAALSPKHRRAILGREYGGEQRLRRLTNIDLSRWASASTISPTGRRSGVRATYTKRPRQ